MKNRIRLSALSGIKDDEGMETEEVFDSDEELKRKKEGFKRWCEKIKSRLTSGSKKAPAPSQLQTATLKA